MAQARQFKSTEEQRDVVTVRWQPTRNTPNEVELSDGTILAGLPDDVEGEPDASAKVVLALLGEILTLRDRLDFIEQKIGGALQPTDTPIPELQGEAQAFREQAQAQAEAENAGKDNPGTPE